MKKKEKLNYVFFSMVAMGDIAKAKCFLQMGANIHYLLSEDDGAMYMKIYKSDIQVVANVLKERADFAMKCPFGYTALHTAVFSGNTEMTRLLLDNGADPLRNGLEGGPTPWDLAQKQSWQDIRSLISKKLLSGSLPAAKLFRRARL